VDSWKYFPGGSPRTTPLRPLPVRCAGSLKEVPGGGGVRFNKGVEQDGDSRSNITVSRVDQVMAILKTGAQMEASKLS
jgi:hypothetical protein